MKTAVFISMMAAELTDICPPKTCDVGHCLFTDGSPSTGSLVVGSSGDIDVLKEAAKIQSLLAWSGCSRMHNSIWKRQYLPSKGQASGQRVLLVLFVEILGAENNISELARDDWNSVKAPGVSFYSS